MHTAIVLVVMAATVVVVVGLCHRLDVPAPLVLIVVGVAASFAPGIPEVHLSSEVVLVGLLPPLLYAIAIQSSLIDFHANQVPILLLSVGLVAFTAIGVGLTVHAVLPGVSWPAAFALGAVVAPPDAVAATAIGRRIGFPRRVLTVLEGEPQLPPRSWSRRAGRYGDLPAGRLDAQADHRSSAGLQHLVPDSLRGVRCR